MKMKIQKLRNYKHYSAGWTSCRGSPKEFLPANGVYYAVKLCQTRNS